MKKRLLSIALVAALLLESFSGVWVVASDSLDAATGTEDAPFEIATVEQFVAFLEGANNTSGTTRHYRLTADILAGPDVSALKNYTAQDVVLDGDGHTVSGFSVAGAIFSQIQGSTIRDVVFSDMTVTASDDSTAVLALETDADTKILGCTFDRCKVNGVNDRMKKTAVIVATSQGAVINCTVTDSCLIRGSANKAGGIAAENGKTGVISNCISQVSIPYATGTTGVLVGQNAGILQRCYGHVSGSYSLYGSSSGAYDAVIDCLQRKKGRYALVNGKNREEYEEGVDLRILAADMSLGTESDNMNLSPDNPDGYGCLWAVEGDDLALSLDGRTAQIYLYADESMKGTTFAFTDTEVLEVSVPMGQKFSVRVGDVENGVFRSNSVTMYYLPENPYTTVNNFVYVPNRDYVKTLPNIIDGTADMTYVDLFISATYDRDTGISTGTTVLYPYCATLSLSNTKEKDEIVDYRFNGSGTEEDPYKISSAYELKCLSHYVKEQKYDDDRPYNEAYYVLICDVDLSGEAFVPIGAYSQDYSMAFRGSFDGQGYEIRGLSCVSGQNYQGLFGVTAGRMVDQQMVEAVIRDLNVVGVDIGSDAEPRDLVGGIVGMAVDTVIDGCVVQGEITGKTQVGGGAGYAYRSRIVNCGANVDITTWSYCAWSGGIAGHCNRGTIENCYSASTFVNQIVVLEEYLQTGSIVGHWRQTDFIRCYYLDAESIDVGRNTIGIQQITMEQLQSEAMVRDLQAYSEEKGTGSVWEQGSALNWNEGYPTIQLTKERMFKVTCEPTTAGNVSCVDAQTGAALEQCRYSPGRTVVISTKDTGLQGLLLVDAQGQILDIPVTREGSYIYSFTMPKQSVWIIPDHGVDALCGHGTEDDPYWIRSQGDLKAMANLINSGTAPAEGCESYERAYYRMIRDVDFDGQAITPISHFSGHFDGDGHRIYDVRLDGRGTALFLELTNAVVRALVLERIAMESMESAPLAHTIAGDTLLTDIMVLDLECDGTKCAGLVYQSEGLLLITNCLLEDAAFSGATNAALVHQMGGNLALLNVLLSGTTGCESTVSKYLDDTVAAVNVFYCDSSCQDISAFGKAAERTLELAAALSAYAESVFKDAWMWTVADLADTQNVRPRLSFGDKGAINTISYADVFFSSTVKLLDVDDLPTTAAAGQIVEIPYYVNSSAANLRIVCADGTELDFTLETEDDSLTGEKGVIRFEMPVGAVIIDNNGQPLKKLYLEGEGSQQKPYEIATPADLVLMADVVSQRQLQYIFSETYVNYNRAWFVLTADLDMTGVAWAGIGTDTYMFHGVFDGDGHTITGLNKDNGQANAARPGLFLSIAETGVVENLSIKDASVFPDEVMNAAGVIAYENDGTIARCQVDDSTIALGDFTYLGGIAGINGATGQIIQCAVRNTSIVRQRKGKGGGITHCNNGTVYGCYVYGCTFTNGTNETDAILVSGEGTAEYCYYYMGESAVDSEHGIAASAESFSSGEMTYKLNGIMEPEYQIWGQTLGKEQYPVLWGATVYPSGDCTHIHGYSNTKARYGHEYDQNGFCTHCGFYQPADLAADGWYEIKNVGQLYWFAALVNVDDSKADLTTREKNVKGRIMASLDMSVATDVWKPIGQLEAGAYTGWFDGGLFPITNLNGMLFGTTSQALLRNITIESGTFSANLGYAVAAGSIAGQMLNSSTLEYSYSKATMSGNAMCDVGGLVGDFDDGRLSDCYYVGSIDNTYSVSKDKTDPACIDLGGLVGHSNQLNIVGCFAYATIGGGDCVGGLIGRNTDSSVFISNSYYHSNQSTVPAVGGTISTSSDKYYKQTEAFTSGEVAYLLQGTRSDLVWGQNLDNSKSKQNYPVLLGARVYAQGSCKEITGYSNTKSQIVHDYDDDGFCDCGAFQPATDENGDGVYEISNAGQLFWFAAVVNGGYEDTPQDTGADAIVTQDIKYSYYTIELPWVMIGSREQPYVGTFDGQGYKISVLSIFDFEELVDDTGMFGYIGETGVVRNVDVHCFIHGVGYVGGIAGYNAGTIENCISRGNVYFSGSYGGGIAGQNTGTITGCVSQGLLSGNGTNVGGIAGYNTGTILGSYHTGSIEAAGTQVGGIAGLNAGTISDCYHAGNIYETTRHVGGIVGVNNEKGKVSYCYSMGTVPEATEYVGAIAGKDAGEIHDCYYKKGAVYNASSVQQYGIGTSRVDEALADVPGRTEEKVYTQFASGEVAYLLQDGRTELVWGQKLESGSTGQEYPVLLGARVYTEGDCTGIKGYSNTEGIWENHHYDAHGFCDRCGGYQPATDENRDSVYEIGNAGQFFWFAAVVNTGYGDTPRNTAARGILIADIDLNDKAWTPIGSVRFPYAGTFDGQGHVITGLMVDAGSRQGVGLFGSLGSSGVIQNVGIDGMVNGGEYTGGIVGQSFGTIERCFSAATVTGTDHVGGIVGVNNGLVTDCYHIGAVKGTKGVGGIAGYSSKDISHCYHVGTLTQTEGDPGQIIGTGDGVARDCYYQVDSSDGDSGKTKEQFASGEVAYLLQDGRKELVWGQDLDNVKSKQAYPVLLGTWVYAKGSCKELTVYSNTESSQSGHAYKNGICDRCSGYQPATDENGDGVYEIGNAGQLFWFAAVVNGGYGDTPGDAKAKAILTANIDLKNRLWTPIGSVDDPYNGTFNGRGYAITGLKVNDESGNGGGLFGSLGSSGVIRNVGIGGTVNGGEYTGGIVGLNCGIIERCFNSGTVMGTSKVGGIVGENRGTVSDCYHIGVVNGTDSVGGIAGYSEKEISHCYHVGDFTQTGGATGKIIGNGDDWARVCYYLAATEDGKGGKTAEQFDSGEVAYLLQDGRTESVWGQDLSSNHPYPALSQKKVYRGGPCQTLIYSNSPLDTVHTYVNGFCTGCNAYQPAEDADGDGVYEISNGGQLYWFAELVNGGESDACALLTADIVINQNMDGVDLRDWVAIGLGELAYEGVFDGDGYSISGLYCYMDFDAEMENVPDVLSTGLFGTVGHLGVVMNLELKDTDFTMPMFTGGIAAVNHGKIQGCRAGATIEAMGAAGGIVGENYGNVTHCVNTGPVNTGFAVGGIAGYHVSGTVRACINQGTIGAGLDDAVSVGGIVGFSSAAVLECENSDTVCGQWFIGGIVGENYIGANLERSFNTAAITGRNSVGGVAGANYGTIRSCYNSGSVEGVGDLGGVGGVAGESETVLESCYNIGTVHGAYDHVGGILGEGLGSVTLVSGQFKVTHCYYLIGCATDGNKTVQNGVGAANTGKAMADVEGQTTGMMEAQFHSGQVTYLLNGSTSEGDLAWGQDLDNGKPKQDWPTLGSAVVYHTDQCSKHPYSNGKPKQGHYFDENGFCTYCGAYQPAMDTDGDGLYGIANGGQLFWYAAVVNGGYGDTPGDAAAQAILTKNIDLGERDWTPIGSEGLPFNGEFDGRGYCITGSSATKNAGGTDSYVGLFGYVGPSGVVQSVGIDGGTVCGSDYVGGIAGYSAGIIKRCFNGATVTGTAAVGGIVGENGGAVSDCYNIGTVGGKENVGGIAGAMGEQGTIYYCHNMGTVTAEQGGLGQITGSGKIEGCYYLSNTENEDGGKTAAQFTSGQVAYLLQHNRDELVWGQNLDNGLENLGYPVLFGNRVYAVGNCAGGIGYSNGKEDLDHVYGDNDICDVCGHNKAAPAIPLAYSTLSLKDEVYYNIYFNVRNIYVDAKDMGLLIWSYAVMNGTFEDAEQRISGAVYDNEAEAYRIQTNGIPAKKLGDTIYFKVYVKLADGTYVYSQLLGCDAVQYAQTILNDPECTDVALKSLMVAMLNYGAAAQVQFGYKTDSLMNKDLTAEQKKLVDAYNANTMITPLLPVAPTKVGDFGVNTGLDVHNSFATISLGGALAINYYFKPSQAVDEQGVTLYYWTQAQCEKVGELTVDNASGSVAMVATADGVYRGSVPGIAAKQIDETVFVAAVYTSGSKQYTTGVVCYSVGEYCRYTSANSKDLALQNLAQETVVYGYYAKAYFDNR